MYGAYCVQHESCVLARNVFSIITLSSAMFVVVSQLVEKKKEKEESKLVALRLIESFPVQKANGVR
jgi:hypothetical protein